MLLEALASGTPVASFPVQGPAEILGTSGAGVLSEDLATACLAALDIDRAAARRRSLRYTWAASARQFLDNVTQARRPV